MLILNDDKNYFIAGEAKYWMGLSRVQGIGPYRVRKLAEYFEGLAGAWEAGAGELLAAGLEGKLVERVMVWRKSFDLDGEMAKLDRLQIKLLVAGDESYPRRLAETEGAPAVLYCRGELTEQDELALAVVGTRKASVYGKNAVERIVTDLAMAGVTIVSGLARGIDTVAHEMAVKNGGRTIAVLGCGVDVNYPPENAKLAERIWQEGRGAVLSEYPPGTQPEADNFPPRNRIISGMSRGVWLVESALKGGALITVTFANEQGREVMVLPGSIFSAVSAGPNALLRQGATAVTSAADILETLKVGQIVPEAEIEEISGDDDVERALLRVIRNGGSESLHIDEIRRECGLSSEVVSAALMMMELKGKVKNQGGMKYGLAVPMRKRA